jgi:hypothetical protein
MCRNVFSSRRVRLATLLQASLAITWTAAVCLAQIGPTDIVSSVCSQAVPTCSDCLAAWRDDSSCTTEHPLVHARCFMTSSGSGTIYLKLCKYSSTGTDNCNPNAASHTPPNQCTGMKVWDCGCATYNTAEAGQFEVRCDLSLCAVTDCRGMPDHENYTVTSERGCAE